MKYAALTGRVLFIRVGGSPDTCLCLHFPSLLGKPGSVQWELEGEPKTVVSDVGVKKSAGERDTRNRRVDQERGPDWEHRGYWLTGRDPVEAEGRLCSRYQGNSALAHLPSPHAGPSPATLRPPPPPLFCFHGDRRRGAGSKHNALWKTCASGDPSRSPRSGPSPEGPRGSPGHVRICESPQSRPRRTGPPSLRLPSLRGFWAPLRLGAPTLRGAPGLEPSPLPELPVHLAAAALPEALGSVPPPHGPHEAAPPPGPPSPGRLERPDGRRRRAGPRWGG